MKKWVFAALAWAGSTAYAVPVEPGWTVLDGFSTLGALASPQWSQQGPQGSMVSNGSTATASGGRAVAILHADTFPGVAFPQMTRLTATSSGSITSLEYASAIVGYQDAQNFCEVRLLGGGSVGSGFYRMFLYQVANGTSTRRDEYLSLDTYGSPTTLKLDTWLDGTALKVHVQPLDGQSGEASGDPIPFTWTDIPAEYAAHRQVGIGGFGAVRIDDFLGYTLPEPMTALLAGACCCCMLVSRRHRR